jgi:hypothetical protein
VIPSFANYTIRDKRASRQSKQKAKHMNKMMHAVVLPVFGEACWFLSLILKLPLMVQPATARLPSVGPEQAVLPAFSRFCMAAGPVVLTVFALLALGYCILCLVAQGGTPGALDRVSGNYDVGSGSGVTANGGGDLHPLGGFP